MKRHYVGNVSIYKREASPYWTAYYRDTAGRQRQKSLKTRNLHVAKERARKIDDLIRTGDEGRLDALQRNRTMTFGEVLERFMGEREGGPVGPGADWAETTRRSMRSFMRQLKAGLADRPIASLRHADLLEFLGTHTTTNSKAAYNRYRAVLRGIFRFAVEAEYIVRSPAEELAFRRPPKRSPKTLTDDELNAVYERLPDYAQVIVQIQVETGLRSSQLFRLQWRDVDTERRTLSIRDPKDGEDMILPLLPRTNELFKRLRAGSQWKRTIGHSYRIIEWPSDQNPTAPVIPKIDIKKSLYKAAEEANLGEGRTVTPHMLRHTWATRLRRAGVPLDRIQELGGWDSYEMVLRYADVPEDLHEAIGQLEPFTLGARKPTAQKNFPSA